MELGECTRVDHFAVTLFEQLTQLVSINDAFYFSDQQLDNTTYRIFNYRLSSYSDFLIPGALECRGIMFALTEEGEYESLVSLPMHKFFNLYENPITSNIDLNEVEQLETKSDGSLISTFLHLSPSGWEVRLKSKGSISSDQVVAATKWFTAPENSHFYDMVESFVLEGFTVNMEWVAPDNRIVLGYLIPRLIVLCIRDILTGTYWNKDHSDHGILEYFEPTVDLNGLSIPEFINQIPDMLDDIEGFVCKTPILWFKVKTKKYLALHHCKDSVNNPRRLFEVILNEGIDDVKSMFHKDELLMKQINDMEQKVDHIYNHMVKEVETFYAVNKHLDRKDYAIKAQAEVTKLYFGLVMNKYVQKPDKYKEFLVSKWKDLGIKDESINND